MKKLKHLIEDVWPKDVDPITSGNANIDEPKLNPDVFYKQFMEAGRSKGKKLPIIDANELERGIQVEYEHTSNRTIATKIALDHLTEISDYYTRLDKMEQQARKEGKVANITDAPILPNNPNPGTDDDDDVFSD